MFAVLVGDLGWLSDPVPGDNEIPTSKRGDPELSSLIFKLKAGCESDNRTTSPLLIPVAGLLCSMFSIFLLRLVSALSFVSFTTAWTTYSVPHSSGGDDTPALTTALSKNNSLRTDATILFQQGLTYNILTPIEFPVLYNVIVSIQGNLTYAANIKETQGENPRSLDTNLLALTFDIHSYQQSSSPR